MGFSDRLTKAKKVEILFIDYCEKKDVKWGYTGIEKIKKDHPEIRDELMKLDTESALNMRFFPDMMTIGKKDSFMIDLKWGFFIEKEAYESYTRLSLSGMNICIINLIQTFPTWKLLFIPIKDLKIWRLPIINGKSHCVIRGISMPNDGTWIYPRDLSADLHQQWKDGGGGSGTPYGEIDHIHASYFILKEYDSWKEIEETIEKKEISK